ncbi:DNA-packaging protein FI [Enterobacteriaceae bacterium H20N1]|uniref:DNA-packaging protein FI n=1 Tax=Dryocola boscaweniae TaxID=2925397 RepID=A0A9X2W8G8_9ENTR|nr:DNA-packaging protein FI [Dryocola boscaweniae]MCT4701219.1 DNA-packaging protein FI [Dryocola boscaweniae]MCT4718276.1 DNA-packaging protein FI [Dryocola boscaweniae]
MNKDELIARLKALGEQLNRDVSLAGSKEDLALRIAELEEELDGDEQPDGDETTAQTSDTTVADSLTAPTGNASETSKSTVSDQTAGELVTVETLFNLHIDALHATKNERVAIAAPGAVIRVASDIADSLVEQDLARHR